MCWWYFDDDASFLTFFHILSFSFQFSIFPLSHLFSTLLYLIVLQLISCTDKKIHSCVTVCLPGQQTLISALSTYEHLPSMNLIQQALTNLPLSVLHTQIKKTKKQNNYKPINFFSLTVTIWGTLVLQIENRR